jgi:hypothetical protein
MVHMQVPAAHEGAAQVAKAGGSLPIWSGLLSKLRRPQPGGCAVSLAQMLLTTVRYA